MMLDSTTFISLGLAAAALALYFYIDDLLRISKAIAYRLGYGAHGHAIISGPMEDTRFTRFSEGIEITEAYRAKYGKIYRVFCGSIPEIVLTDPEHIKLYYQGDGKVHLKRPNVGFGHYLGKVLGESVGLKHNEDWRRLRANVDPHFSLAMASDSIPLMTSDVTEWLEKFTTDNTTKAPTFKFPAGDLTSELPFKMVARRLFGDLLTPELFTELFALNSYHERMMSHAFFGKIEQYALSAHLPSKANRDLHYFEDAWAKLLHRVALEAKEEGVHTAVTDMYKNMQDGEMTFIEYAHTIDEILFTNIDVTTISISWSVTLVAQHPDIQDRLAKEIRSALNDPKNGMTQDARIEVYMRKTDTLLHYCYLEAGRVRPILFYSLPELTADPKVLGSHYIPGRTSVLVDAYTLNRHSPVWGNDGESFRPDRFKTLNPTDYRYSFWRFGLGPRKCVGMHFGDKIIKSCLLQIIDKYNVTVDGVVGVKRDKFVQFPDATLVFKPREQNHA